MKGRSGFRFSLDGVACGESNEAYCLTREMSAVRRPYKKRIMARRGIEYGLLSVTGNDIITR